METFHGNFTVGLHKKTNLHHYVFLSWYIEGSVKFSVILYQVSSNSLDLKVLIYMCKSFSLDLHDKEGSKY